MSLDGSTAPVPSCYNAQERMEEFQVDAEMETRSWKHVHKNVEIQMIVRKRINKEGLEWNPIHKNTSNLVSPMIMSNIREGIGL